MREGAAGLGCGVRISIIVPAFNEERLLGATLEAIGRAAVAFERRGWEWELIVCDNRSTDRTAEIAREFGARVVFEGINQISRARNAGAAAADGDWLGFVDADSEPTEELMEEVAERMAGGRVLAGGVTLRMVGTPLLARMVIGCWNGLSRLRRWFAGSFIFVEAEAFRRVGGFSVEWFAAEEIEFCGRLQGEARRLGRTVEILHRHPLATSARKVELYRPWEMVRMLGRAVFSGGKSLRRRETTELWYDGRR